jgi:hypothetical protein
MSLAKNLGGRVGVKENFLGGGVKKILKILLLICDNPERSQKFSEKMAFFSQKSKKFLQKCHFFSKILLRKILGGVRVAFNKNFIGGREYFKPPPPPSHTPPPLNSCMPKAFRCILKTKINSVLMHLFLSFFLKLKTIFFNIAIL